MFFRKTLTLFIISIHTLLCFSQTDANNTNRFQKNFFIENKGQLRDQNQNTNNAVLFYNTQNQLQYFIKENGFSYQIQIPDSQNIQAPSKNFSKKGLKESSQIAPVFKIFRVDVNLVNANRPEKIIKSQKSDYYENFVIPDKQSGELKDYNHCYGYEKITLINIYPNIDWVIYFKNGSIKYDFIVHPGGASNDIQLAYDGIDNLSVSPQGNLIIQAQNSTEKIEENAPISFSNNQEIQTKFKRINPKTIGFEFQSSYDQTQDLIIDPCLKWGSYYGGASHDYGKTATLDAKGNIIQCGYTLSNVNFATTGAFQTTFSAGYSSLYYIKINPITSVPIYATYVYGTANSYNNFGGIATYGNEIVIAGYTTDASNLISSGASQKTFGGGGYDGIIVQFSEAGSLNWATYCGGAGTETINGICTDKNGNIAVYGGTSSTTNIATTGAFRTYSNGSEISFISKYNWSGTKLYGSYVTGTTPTTYDYTIYDATFDKNGNLYIVGATTSSSITNYNSASFALYPKSTATDGFIVRFSSANVLQWFTYYGGTSNDYFYGCNVDINNNFFITGCSQSTTNISTSGTAKGLLDGIIIKFNSAGARQWGFYYGGTGSDYLEHITSDLNGDIYCTGTTASTGWFTADAFQTTSSVGSPNHILKVNTSGTILWNTAYTGYSNGATTMIKSIITDSKNDIYVSGYTSQSTEVTNIYGYRTSLYNNDGFIGKIGTGTISNTFDNNTLCNGVTSLSLCRKVNLSGTLAWDNGAVTACRTITTPGTYWVKNTSTAQGCTFIDTFKVSVLKNIATITQLSPYCTSGQAADLMVKSLNKYSSVSWYNPNKSLFSLSSKATASITGNYIAILVSPIGCKDTARYNLAPSPLDIRISKAPKAIPCGNTFVPEVKQGTPVNLTYSWNPTTNLSNPKIKDPIIIASETNKRYILTTSYNSTCVEYDTLDVNTISPLNQTITFQNNGPAELCAGDSITLVANCNPTVATSYNPNYPISLYPILPKRDQTVKILFDATKGNGGLKGVSSVYITFASVTNAALNSNYWYNIQSTWGKPDAKYQLKNEGADLWSYTFNIRDVFNLNNVNSLTNSQLAITHLAMVFSDSSFTKFGKTENNTDIFYPVFDTLNANINNTPIQLIQPAIFNLETSSNLDLYSNDSLNLIFGAIDKLASWNVYRDGKLGWTFTDTNSINFKFLANTNQGIDTLSISAKTYAGVTYSKTMYIRTIAKNHIPDAVQWTWPDNANPRSNFGDAISKQLIGGAAGKKQVIAKVSFAGCNYNANNYEVNVINSTKPNFTTTPTIICDNGINNITLNGGTTINNTSGSYTVNYKWYFEDNTSLTGLTVNKKFAKIGNNSIKLITYTDARCKDSFIKSITVIEKPVLAITSNTTNFNYCEGNTSIYATPTFLSTYKWYYENAPNSWDLLQSNRILAPSKPGTYIIVAADYNGCKDTEMITLNKVPVTIEAPNGVSWCDATDKITLQTKETFTKYLWNTGALTKSITTNQIGTFTVKGINGTCTTTSEPITIIDEKKNFTANFTVSQLAGYKFQFNPKIAPKYASWSFGDGDIDITNNPIHSFTNKGFYSVCLDAKSRCGNRDFKCVSLNVDGKYLGLEDSIAKPSFSVYKTPQSNRYSLLHSVISEPYQYCVFSIYGAQITPNYDLLTQPGFDLNVSSGIYFIKIWNSQNQFTIKFNHGE